MILDIIIISVLSILLLWFLLVAFKDLGMLIRRPTKLLGTGLNRVWAVAHTTMLEAWAGRVWLLPLLWFVVSLVILLVIRPFDESDRITLDIRVLLSAQEILLLVMIWVMASVSLPRERERKTIVTNASKPLSRLEILLGKMVGFSMTALLLLAAMTLASWAILLVADQRIRSNARAEYALAEDDFKARMQQNQKAVPPPMEKLDLANDGSLFAYNHITVPPGGMSIVGRVESTPGGLVRFIKGGSDEQAIYRFAPRLPGDQNADLAGPGQRPYFRFCFPAYPYVRNIPQQVEIQVTAVRAKQRLRPQEKMLFLDPQNGWTAMWEPDNPEELFSFPGQRDNGEIELTITCPTAGVFLEVRDGVTMDKATSIDQFNMAAFPSRASGQVYVPLPNPQIRGFERRDRQQISGPSKKETDRYGEDVPLETAIYRFPPQDLRGVPVDATGHFKVTMNLDIDKESHQELDTIAWVEVYNTNSPTERFDTDTPVIEKRRTDVDVPESFLGGPDPSKRGDLVVLLHCRTMGHWISLLEDSVRIEQPPSPFLLNLVKSEIVIFAEATLLVVICVACSVPLGWPVAMLTAATLFFLGSMRGFINDLQDLGGLLALGYSPIAFHSGVYKFFDHVTAGLWKFLDIIVSFTPDFRRFDFLTSITQLREMPNSSLLVTLGWTFLYAVPFIGLGYIFFRKQELG